MKEAGVPDCLVFCRQADACGSKRRERGALRSSFGVCSGMMLALAFATWMAQGAEENVLGFWNFADGAAGTESREIRNSSGSGTYVGQSFLTSPNAGKLPEFSDLVPGPRLARSSSFMEFYDQIQSIRFTYNDDAEESPEMNGGFISIANLADDLTGLPAWTIEYFFRLDDDWVYDNPHNGKNWERISKTALYLNSYDKGLKMVVPASASADGIPSIFQIQKDERVTPKARLAKWGEITKGEWHHVAAVFSVTNQMTGKLELFYDYQAIGTMAYDNRKEGSGYEFILGTGRPDKRSTERYRGYLSGLRVSSKAYTIPDFLRAAGPSVDRTTIGVWDMKDQESGKTVISVENRIAPGEFVGIASSASGGPVPTFSGDRPSPYVISDIYGELVAGHPQSVQFSRTTEWNGGKVKFDGLGQYLTSLPSYTIEFFMKSTCQLPWKTIASMGLGEKTGWNLKMNYSAVGILGIEVMTNTVESTLKNIPGQVASTGVPNLSDGKWHHVACVYEAQSEILKVYWDYKQIMQTRCKNGGAGSSVPFVLGTTIFPFKEYEGFDGELSTLRISKGAFVPDQFMKTAERPSDERVVFAYSFDEGADHIGEVVRRADGYPTRELAAEWEYNVCGETAMPKFSTDRPVRKLIQWGTKDFSTNTASIAFYGPQAVIDVGGGSAHWAGTEFRRAGSSHPRQNPQSWTMEALVKARCPTIEENAYGALLFGKCGNVDPHNRHGNQGKLFPRYCWLLNRRANGNICLYANGVDGSEKGKENWCEFENSNQLDDGGWHHIALTYDQPTRTFQLFIDYQKIGEKTFAEELFDGPYDYEFSRNSETCGFEGWMDEIRFSNAVLTPEQMIHCALVRWGLMLIVK